MGEGPWCFEAIVKVGRRGQQGEVQRLPLMARIFLCLANAASVLAGTGPITVIVCLRPPAVMAFRLQPMRIFRGRNVELDGPWPSGRRREG